MGEYTETRNTPLASLSQKNTFIIVFPTHNIYFSTARAHREIVESSIILDLSVKLLSMEKHPTNTVYGPKQQRYPLTDTQGSITTTTTARQQSSDCIFF